MTNTSPRGSAKAAHEPYYAYIARRLREDILAGVYAVGDRLPSETELSESFGVSRMTARLAVTQLVDDDTAYRVQGRGAFVARTTITRDPDSLVGFHQAMLNLGLQPGSRIIHFDRRLPDSREQRFLKLGKDNPVYDIRRIRFLNDDPIGVQHLTLPAALAPDLDQSQLESVSFYGLFREWNVPIVDAHQRIEAVQAPEVAERLAVPVNTSFLRIERVSSTTGGRPVELLVSWFRGDRYSYEMDLRSNS